jgi:photosystem II stability/assembly factor-like uncharacterized protein
MFSKQLLVVIIFNIISLLALPQNDLHAQGWQWQNPLPQGNRLGEVQFVDSLYGWIRTGGGTILRTIDGGRTWEEEVIGRGPQRLYFVDRLHGWAVGSGAPPFIVRTRDGGQTWENLPLPAERNSGDYYNFLDVYFLDIRNGYFTDDAGGIFHTTDGGQTWTRQFQHRQRRDIRSIWFADSLRGWAIGEPPLLYTANGGRVWLTDSTVMGGIDALPRRIFFIDSLHGWVLTGKTNIYRTPNGGKIWTRHLIDSVAVVNDLDPLLGEFISKEIMFLNPQQGWLATSWGLYSSSDSGKTWQRLNREYGFDGVYFVNTRHGWVTGGNTFARIGAISNQIFETLDGGMTLQSKTKSVTNATLWGVDFIDAMTGWAVGVDGTILHTIDGGKTWVHQASPSVSWLKKVIFIDKNTGWIVGYGGTILHTKDGGQIWQKQNSGTNYALVEASFVSKQKGWVVGWSLDTDPVSGIVLHTNDGGATWQNQTPAGIGRLYGVAFIDSLRGWIAVGGGSLEDVGGKLYRTLDGGRTWEIQLDKPGDAFSRIVFVDSLHGWVASPNGILRTIDGGRTWETKARAMSVGLFNIQFVDRLHGWAVGSGGIITHTRDGGETWVAQQSKTSLTLWDIDFVNENIGWTVGYFGIILHTTTGGLTSVVQRPTPSSLPSSFELYQNYPNPFNAQTILSFRLYHSQTKVTVAIYNLMGELVTTLLNDRLPAGDHRVIWGGTNQYGKNVSSGIYLYQIRADEQKRAGKMILLR